MFQNFFFNVSVIVFLTVNTYAQRATFNSTIATYIKKNNLDSKDTTIVKGIYFQNGAGEYYGKIWLFFIKNSKLHFQYVFYSTNSKRKNLTILQDTLIHDFSSSQEWHLFLRSDWENIMNEFQNINRLLGVRIVKDGYEHFVRGYQNGKKIYLGIFIGRILLFDFDTPFYEMTKIATNTKSISKFVQLVDMSIIELFE